MSDTKQLAPKSESPAFSRALSEETVIVVVGAEQKQYYLHRAFLIHHSEYFRNALKGPWKEAEDGVVPLTDVDVEVFDVFAQWIYTQKMDESYDIDDNAWARLDASDRKCSVDRSSWIYLKAFVFGDRFLAYGFRHAAHQKFSALGIQKSFWQVDRVAIVRYAYDNVPSYHPLLQQIADEYRHDMCQWEACHKEGGITSDMTSYYYKRLFGISAQRSLPVEFLLRVNKGIQQHGLEIEVPQYYLNWHQEHCYLEHVSEEGKKECGKLHVEYDEYMGYGFYERKDGDDKNETHRE